MRMYISGKKLWSWDGSIRFQIHFEIHLFFNSRNLLQSDGKTNVKVIIKGGINPIPISLRLSQPGHKIKANHTHPLHHKIVILFVDSFSLFGQTETSKLPQPHFEPFPFWIRHLLLYLIELLSPFYSLLFEDGVVQHRFVELPSGDAKGEFHNMYLQAKQRVKGVRISRMYFQYF